MNDWLQQYIPQGGVVALILGGCFWLIKVLFRREEARHDKDREEDRRRVVELETRLRHMELTRVSQEYFDKNFGELRASFMVSIDIRHDATKALFETLRDDIRELRADIRKGKP